MVIVYFVHDSWCCEVTVSVGALEWALLLLYIADLHAHAYCVSSGCNMLLDLAASFIESTAYVCVDGPTQKLDSSVQLSGDGHNIALPPLAIPHGSRIVVADYSSGCSWNAHRHCHLCKDACHLVPTPYFPIPDTPTLNTQLQREYMASGSAWHLVPTPSLL
jgi:hypothetical protein